MSDPTLTRARVTISYNGSDGYRSEKMYCSHPKHFGRTPPENVLLEAIEELSRLCALFGYGEQATRRVDDARKRVDDWRATRKADHE